MSGQRVTALDQLQARGMHIDFYDPDGRRYGLPTYPWRCAPDGLATIRQLRARGLRPAGQPVTAQIIWRHRGRRRIAYLYRTSHAVPKRPPTPAQLLAIAAALRARRAARPPHLPVLRRREALLHPEVSGRMPGLRPRRRPLAMPRRNRNAGTPRPDVDQLAAELDQLAASLCPGLLTGPGKSAVLVRYLVRTVTPGCLLTVTGGKQPIPQLTLGSR